jgi:methyl-accepting chemotaxis protein
MSMNLRNRFLVPTVGALAISFAAYLAITTHQTTVALNASVADEMTQINRLVLNDLQSWLDHREADVNRWAELPALQMAVAAPDSAVLVAAEALLHSQAEHTTDYEGLYLVDAAGLAVASSRDGMTGKLNVGDREYFQECLRSNRTVISAPVASKITGMPIIVVCNPVQNASGRPVGAVLGLVDLDHFATAVIDPIKVGATGYAFVCDKEGTFLAHPKPELILKSKVTEWDFGKQIMAEGNGLIRYNFKGIDRQAAFTRDEKSGWICAVALDESQVLAAAHRMRNIGILLTIAALLAVGTIVLMVARSVTGPINRMIADLNVGSDQTTVAASEIANASVTLANQSSEQAAAVEETTASLQEMSASVRHTTDAADNCQKLMNTTRSVVQQGMTAMGAMGEAIDTIKNGADRTAHIVKTIDEIAFQTNLLALNAAVEAARAGEAGKGFAVVAEEVRNLAQRAASAAKETSELIEQSVSHAEKGVQVTAGARAAFTATAENSDKVATQVDVIASSARSQAEGISQISTAMHQVDSTTQSVAANAEETAASAEELNAQAEQLRSVVAQLQALVTGRKADGGERHEGGGMSDRQLHAMADSGRSRALRGEYVDV